MSQSVTFQGGEVTWYAGRPPSPMGARDCPGTAALNRFYRCVDGWLLLACSRPEHFHLVCEALAHPEWAARLTAERAMREPRDGDLAAGIAAALAPMERDDVVDRLTARGIPVAPSLAPDEMFDDAFLHANDYFDEWEHPQFGLIRGTRSFATWNGIRCRFPRRTPLLGEHTVEVFRDFGFGPERIDALLANGAAVQGQV
jgi:crotonobetainyl-CoA:carnitine CoA-transferase CaiB-like acyl-CoA transferase